MTQQRISKQLLLAGTLPAAVVALVVVCWLVSLRIADLQQHQESLGQAVVSQLAPAAEYGVFSGNVTVLQRLAEATLEQADLRSVSIKDRDGHLLAYAEKSHTVEMHRWNLSMSLASSLAGPDATRVFKAEVLQGDIGLGDFALPPEHGNATLGSVEIEVPLAPELAAQLRVVLAGLAILLLGIFASVSYARRLGRRIAGPIEQLADAMGRVQRGEPGVRVPETSTNELGMLETGLNRMADEVSRTQQNLEEQVAQATQEIQQTVEALEVSNVELDLARKRALEASHLKSEFLAAMSHDIRTPMSGIIGFTQLLAKTPLEPDQREHVLTIERSALGLMRIINNILDLSRIEAGRLELTQEPFDVRSCLDDVLMLLSPLAYEKQLVINRCVHADVPWILSGDQTRVQEIVTNLLSNAIKFTDKGIITLQLRLADRPVAGEDITLEVCVSDTGRGMNETTKRQLFQAFGQSSPSTAKYPGTGLGLVICNRLVEAMGGDIRLESAPGQGSSFAATLKLGTVENQDIGLLTAGTACLLESEPLTQSHLSQLLESLGYEVHFDCPMERDVCVVNGEDSAALAAASGHERLVVLLDQLGSHKPEHGIALPRVAGRGALERALAGWQIHSPVDHGTTLEGVSVLVVDDSRINRSLIGRQLEGLGARVVLADGGAAALDLDLTGMTVALIDLQMPGMSGTDFAAMLSRARPCPALIAVTADATAELGHWSFHAGFVMLLVKPINADELIDTIREVLERKQAVIRQLAALPGEIRGLLAEDLPSITNSLFSGLETHDDAAIASALHDLKGIAGACKLRGLQAAAHESTPHVGQGMMNLYTELALIRAEMWPEWKDGI